MKISMRLGLFAVIWFAFVFATMASQSQWMLLSLPLMVVSFCLGATLLAVWCRGKERAFYVGFVVFSFGFIFFGQPFKDIGPFSLIDSIIGGVQYGFEETETTYDDFRAWVIASPRFRPPANWEEDYVAYRFVSDTTKLGLVPMFGLIGGLFSTAVFERSSKQNHSSETDTELGD